MNIIEELKTAQKVSESTHAAHDQLNNAVNQLISSPYKFSNDNENGSLYYYVPGIEMTVLPWITVDGVNTSFSFTRHLENRVKREQEYLPLSLQVGCLALGSQKAIDLRPYNDFGDPMYSLEYNREKLLPTPDFLGKLALHLTSYTLALYNENAYNYPEVHRVLKRA